MGSDELRYSMIEDRDLSRLRMRSSRVESLIDGQGRSPAAT